MPQRSASEQPGNRRAALTGRGKRKGIENGRGPFFSRGETPLKDLFHDLIFKERVGERRAEDVAFEDLPLRRDDELDRHRPFDLRVLLKPSAVELEQPLFVLARNSRDRRLVERL